MKTKDGTKFEEAIFRIRCLHGPRRVVGFVCGLLGYTRYYDEETGGPIYSITHLPTGLRILAVKRATEARWFITQALKLDWNFNSQRKAEGNLFACNRIVDELNRRNGGLVQ